MADLKSLIEKELNLDVGSADTDLIESGLLDSLLLVDLIMLLERHFGVTIDINELELDEFRTIRSIDGLIERASGR